VIEPGRTEVVTKLAVQPLVLAQDDAGEHGAPLSFQAGRH